MTRSDLDTPATDVRFALVLNGGVSLAVWMGGVTHELNNARMASAGHVTGPEGGVRQAWQRILEAVGRTVSIDLIAGTSAGGLNGTLLATAVARGADMPEMGSQWRDLASLTVGSLVRDDAALNSAKSVLDGAFFEREITRLVSGIASKGSDAPAPRPCTLLVTATALDSEAVAVELRDGGSFHCRDGRRVFRFRKQDRVAGLPEDVPEPDDDFADHVALARAARASASFPMAFEPVFETPDLVGRRHPPSAVGPSWLVDGGVLDNAPFGPLLAAIREAPLTGPYERTLLYVTPGVDHQDAAGHRVGITSPPLRRVLSLLVAASREPDERLDVDDLDAAFRLMSYTLAQPAVVLAELATMESPAQARRQQALNDAAGCLFDSYRRGRAESLERTIHLNLNGRAGLHIPDPPVLAVADIPTMPRCWPAAAPYAWGWSTTDRILRWFGRTIVELDPALISGEHRDELYRTLADAQNWMGPIGIALDAAISPVPGRSNTPESLLARLRTAYALGDPPLSVALGNRIRDVAQAMSAAIGVSTETLLTAAFSLEVITSGAGWSIDDYEQPKFSYTRLTPTVKPVVHFGAVTANHDWPVRKLYGERWGHFGAFSAPDNRTHDWRWGRLDGATALATNLMARPVIGPRDGGPVHLTEVRRRELLTGLVDAIIAAEGTSRPKIAAGAEVVYKTKVRDLYRSMVKSPQGERTMQQLVATVVALTGPSDREEPNVLHTLLRLIFAEHWGRREMPRTWSRSTRWVLAPVVRHVAAPLLRRKFWAAVFPTELDVAPPTDAAVRRSS